MSAGIFQPFGISRVIHEINLDEVRSAPGAVKIAGDTHVLHVCSDIESIIQIGFSSNTDGTAREESCVGGVNYW